MPPPAPPAPLVVVLVLPPPPVPGLPPVPVPELELVLELELLELLVPLGVHTPLSHMPPVQAVPSVAVGLLHCPVAIAQLPATWHSSDAVQTTAGPPTQAPAMHVSSVVQPLPSLQVVPSVAAGLEQAPVVMSQVPTAWHGSLAAQTTGLAPVQVPATQVSVWVQALPSLQVVPSVAAGLVQAPVVMSQVPTAWHGSRAVQVTGFDPVQIPAMQASVWVQALPSLQVVPSVAAGLEQAPEVGSQVPAAWHWSLAEHTTGLVPTQAPAWQVSVWVQALPSLHAVPLAPLDHAVVEVAGAHTWHGLAGLTVPEPKKTPPISHCAPQEPLMQSSPAPQLAPSGRAGWAQVPAPSQALESQGLPLLGQATPAPLLTMVQLVPLQVELAWQLVGVQVKAVPAQVPAVHTSLEVQALPSLQVVPSVTFDHAVVEVAGAHAWQALAGLMVPEP